MSNYTSDATNRRLLESDWIFIGISGVTNGGKTHLTEYLKQRFPGSVTINQDTFFRSEQDPNHVMVAELNHANWEAMCSIDWDRLLDTINETTNQPPTGEPLFFVEGHIIFNHPKLVQLFRRKYFFTLTEEECYNRRRYRTYDPPDPPGYYDLVVWPMYLKNKEEMERSVKDVIYLDGAGNQEEIHRAVGDEIQKLLVELSYDHCS
ncbi:nicotinamide riboside kinase 1-like [Ornithodoros turicata]|uniref:nicotinamide riboside kinase 1-like n=1 Tax=Ornithodoros turicata TaxID=34597 RepID=UPI00313A3B2C